MLPLKAPKGTVQHLLSCAQNWKEAGIEAYKAQNAVGEETGVPQPGAAMVVDNDGAEEAADGGDEADDEEEVLEAGGPKHHYAELLVPISQPQATFHFYKPISRGTLKRPICPICVDAAIASWTETGAIAPHAKLCLPDDSASGFFAHLLQHFMFKKAQNAKPEFDWTEEYDCPLPGCQVK